MNLTHQTNTKDLIILVKDQTYLAIGYTLAAQTTSETKSFGNILLGRVYPKLLTRELALRVLFDKSISIHEDNLWSIETLGLANRIGLSNKIYYSYKINPYSITHKSYKKEDIEKEIEFANIIMLRYLNQYYDAAKVRLLTIILAIVNMSASLNLNSREVKEYLTKILTNFDNINVNFSSFGSFELSKYKVFIAKILSVKSLSLRVFLINLLVKYKRLK